jgi:hypothetical protein
MGDGTLLMDQGLSGSGQPTGEMAVVPQAQQAANNAVNNKRPWSDAQTAYALELAVAGSPWARIAERLDRTSGACRDHVEGLCRRVEAGETVSVPADAAKSLKVLVEGRAVSRKLVERAKADAAKANASTAAHAHAQEPIVGQAAAEAFRCLQVVFDQRLGEITQQLNACLGALGQIEMVQTVRLGIMLARGAVTSKALIAAGLDEVVAHEAECAADAAISADILLEERNTICWRRRSKLKDDFRKALAPAAAALAAAASAQAPQSDTAVGEYVGWQALRLESVGVRSDVLTDLALRTPPVTTVGDAEALLEATEADGLTPDARSHLEQCIARPVGGQPQNN